MRVALALLVGFVVAATTASAQEQLADLKPLVGKWRGYVTSPLGSAPVDLIVQEDGSYSTILYVQPSRTITGTLEVADGKAKFKNSEGNAGTFTLYVDGKGKRVLKGTRNDGITVEYEPLK